MSRWHFSNIFNSLARRTKAVGQGLADFCASNGAWKEALDEGDLIKIEQLLRKTPRFVDAKVRISDDEYDSPPYPQTALQFAAYTSNRTLARLLLENGARQDFDTAKSGPTPLMLAADLHDIEMVKLLLQYDTAHINMVQKVPDMICDAGATALTIAEQTQNPGIINLLLAHGAKAGTPPAPPSPRL